MIVYLNGKEHETAEGTLHIGDLMVELDLSGQPVLVEHNGNALFPRDFESTKLAANDKIELIRVVAGG